MSKYFVKGTPNDLLMSQVRLLHSCVSSGLTPEQALSSKTSTSFSHVTLRVWTLVPHVPGHCKCGSKESENR